VTDERDNDPDRLIHPETWPCDPATLGPVFHGWDTSPGMIELRGVGAVYSVEAGKVYVLQLVPIARVSEARQQAQDYVNAAARLAGTRS
jgi:hypothetical protein